MPPNRSTVARTQPWIPSAWLRSATQDKHATWYFSSISPAAARSRLSVRAQIESCAPSAARPRAIALPIPLLAPDTNATCREAPSPCPLPCRVVRPLPPRPQAASRRTGFRSVPIPSIVMLTMSPGRRACASGTRIPVPVESTVPGGTGL